MFSCSNYRTLAFICQFFHYLIITILLFKLIFTLIKNFTITEK